ncbi:SRPBCC domain-containing protein [Mucilaginibacter ximonensis]|uniref:SRPBCC domain-containing protein n=1 Tax=Mucilaginibacter ximonensis TaxID=538021 RepID=A0ABW5Y775_9SPHI
MKEHIVKKQIDITAPIEAVWDALTNPEKTKKYFFHCRVKSTWKPGSQITFKGRLFWIIPIELRGVIDKVDQPWLLQYTLHNRKDSSQSVVTDKLTHKNGITTIHITDDVGSGEGAEKRYRKSVKGWDKVLKGLKELCEEN